MIQLFVAILLFFVIFFGISFILNMLLRRTWFMAFLYPIIVILIVDNIPFTDYFKSPIQSLQTTFSDLLKITYQDGLILLAGFVGTIVSGFVIKYLRKQGYQMF